MISVNTEAGSFGLKEWAGLMSGFPQYANRAISSALRSEGMRIRQVIQSAMMQGGANREWPLFHLHTLAIRSARKRHLRWQAQEAKGSKVRAATRAKYRGHRETTPAGQKPLARYIGAVRYNYSDAERKVTIGFLNEKVRDAMKRHAAGFSRPVDERMRKYLAMMGFPVKRNTVLKIPARPVVSPVFEKEKNNIVNNVQLKILNNIIRYITGKQKDVTDPL